MTATLISISFEIWLIITLALYFLFIKISSELAENKVLAFLLAFFIPVIIILIIEPMFILTIIWVLIPGKGPG